MTQILNEWNTDAIIPIEIDNKLEPKEIKILEQNLNKLKAQISQLEYKDIEVLKKEIKKIGQCKGSQYSKLNKLNRNLAILK